MKVKKIANEENKTINTPQGELTPVTENKTRVLKE